MGQHNSVSWLHISDLHLEAGASYDQQVVLKALVRDVAGLSVRHGIAPDLIFVTGDLAAKGLAAEYDNAGKFFDDLLRVAKVPKERLFVVPGNHDVDRCQCEHLQRTLQSQADADRYFEFSDKRPNHYKNKLKAFADWHDGYFGAGSRFDHNVAAPAPAVVDINSVRVGILPINTALFAADDSDHGRLWVGRRWLDSALAKIVDRDLGIALAHHPLDWLHDEERSVIRSKLHASCDLLLRGHLHENDLDSAVSAGGAVVQLAAGATYQHYRWPRRALFARVDLASQNLSIVPLQYSESPHGRWTLDATLFPDAENYVGVVDLVPKAAASGPTGVQATKARTPSGAMSSTHERTYSVDASDGITEVTVELVDVSVTSELVLAVLTPPFCGIDADASAQPGDVPVNRTDLPDGRTKFSLHGPCDFKELRWQYRFSAGLAVSKDETSLVRNRGLWLPNLEPDEDGRPHVVRFPTKQLLQTVEIVDDLDTSPIHCRAVVERWNQRKAGGEWERIPAEEERCAVEHVGDSAVLRVDGPLPDCRYTLAYKPRRAREPANDYSSSINAKLLASRAGRPELPRLNHWVNQQLGRVFTEQFGLVSGEDTWVYLGWHDTRRQLLTCLGDFPNRTWSTRFNYGFGVAGHAYRFRQVALWHAEGGPRSRLFFQTRTPEGPYEVEYRWVVCIPVLDERAALGVVSFAGDNETSSDFGKSMDALACALTTDPQSSEKRKIDEMFATVNGAFWTAMEAASNFLTPEECAFAANVMSAMTDAGKNSTLET